MRKLYAVYEICSDHDRQESYMEFNGYYHKEDAQQEAIKLKDKYNREYIVVFSPAPDWKN